jgi:hypothetical protein
MASPPWIDPTDLRGAGDGIDGQVGHRAVAAFAFYDDVEGAGGGEDDSHVACYRSGRQAGPDVQAEDLIDVG